MTSVEWAVVLGGAATIAWINWYFFLAGRGSAGMAARNVEDGKEG